MSQHPTPIEDSYWPAPLASAPLRATLTIPGSKSVTARALLLAAIADRPSVLEGALASRDTDLMAEALRVLGATITADPSGVLHITPMPTPALLPFTEREITCGLAGTVMRFLPLIAALYPGRTRFEGDPEASARPMAPLLDIAEQLGAQVICHGEPGRLPFTIVGVRPQVSGSYSFPQVIEVEASASSQFLSAALLVAPLLGVLDGQARVICPRGEVVSLPHVEMTAEALQARGVHVAYDPALPVLAGRGLSAVSGPSWTVTPSRPEGGHFTVEPDLSNAGVFLVAAMLTGGTVRIRNWPTRTTQAGDAWRHLLASLGATVVRDHDDLIVTGPRDEQGRASYPGFDWDLSAIGELTPTIAALALFASSPCALRGVAHIRGHETDRLAALAAEIRRLGGEVIEYEDGLAITPSVDLPQGLHAADLESYADHRMATFGALVGLRVPGVRVADIATTSKTLPGFAQMWQDFLCPPTSAEHGNASTSAHSHVKPSSPSTPFPSPLSSQEAH
ncbi:3-phosphoshikimate 1-carboxyvinyltransferase [Schaalia sp. Marseille-Q2122]|uniref:3-phosphoshikimate 1-carboxyvinyltransferase n=1 Tax=Schaalia sp. Marseille-Q2122 TaxID=2736604 RepID=UPI0015894B79|nr:3-phosphoshikimate 1-carboxyvinyltransferase [Schaalia sp. Marseille-Q2122]